MRIEILRAVFKLIQVFWEVTPAQSGAGRPILALTLTLALALTLSFTRIIGEYLLAEMFLIAEDLQLQLTSIYCMCYELS